MKDKELASALQSVKADGRCARIAWAIFRTNPKAAIDYALGFPLRRNLEDMG